METPPASTTPKPFVFVLMPFDPAFGDIYKLGIKAACEEAGTYCERVDEQIFTENMMLRVYNQIAKADLIIADMTGRNPNVFYEVGYAHALGKQVILLTKKNEDIPFDLKHYPHIVYDSIVAMKDALLKKIKWFVTHPNILAQKTSMPFELFLDGNLVSEKLILTNRERHLMFLFELSVHNSSTRLFAPDSFQIGLITSNWLRLLDVESVRKTITQPDGKIMRIFNPFGTLFPDAWDSCGLRLVPDVKNNPETKSEVITFRVYTEVGPFDSKCTLLLGS